MLAVAGAVVVLALLSTMSLPGFLRVGAPEDGVTVKALSADLAFGADALGEPAPLVPLAEANTTSLTDVRSLVAPEELFDDEEPVAPPPREFHFEPPPDPCPTASEATFPDEPASTLVKGTTPAGVFRWKQSGSFQVIGLFPLPLPPLTTRTVRMVPASTPAALFAYEMEQVGYSGTEIDTFEVRFTGQGATDGVYLTRLQYRTRDFAIDFNPSPLTAPQLFALPITGTPSPVTATAVDLDDRLALQVTGQVDGRNRVRLDACGEVVEAWKFSGQRVLQGLPPNQDQEIRNSTYELYLAPQLGALIVGDHLVTHGNIGPFQYQSDITTNIGGLKPLGAG